VGTVDYRLLSSFVRQLRENADSDSERWAKADIERLAAIADGLRPLPPRKSASVTLLPSRDG
jgi:hypothetical protein